MRAASGSSARMPNTMASPVVNTRTTVRPVGAWPSTGSIWVRLVIESAVDQSASSSAPSIRSAPDAAATFSAGRLAPSCASTTGTIPPSATTTATPWTPLSAVWYEITKELSWVRRLPNVAESFMNVVHEYAVQYSLDLNVVAMDVPYNPCPDHHDRDVSIGGA